MRFQISHWDMSTPHHRVRVEVDVAGFDAASTLAHELAGFGHSVSIVALPEPVPEPEPEELLIEVELDDPRPKRRRRAKREGA
jgi:hypothetical protein